MSKLDVRLPIPVNAPTCYGKHLVVNVDGKNICTQCQYGDPCLTELRHRRAYIVHESRGV
jgi:hypothetical protein